MLHLVNQIEWVLVNITVAQQFVKMMAPCRSCYMHSYPDPSNNGQNPLAKVGPKILEDLQEMLFQQKLMLMD